MGGRPTQSGLRATGRPGACLRTGYTRCAFKTAACSVAHACGMPGISVDVPGVLDALLLCSGCVAGYKGSW